MDIHVVSTEPAPASPAAPTTVVRSTRDWTIAAASGAAGLIHLANAPTHLTDSAVLGAGFLLAGWAQIGLAAAVLARPGRRWHAAVVMVGAALTAVWITSRTAGLPFGSHTEPEPVGVADALCVLLQLTAAALAVAALRPAPDAGARRSKLAAWRLHPAVPTMGVALLATIALVAPGVGGGHSHDAEELATGGHAHDEDGGDHDHASTEMAAGDHAHDDGTVTTGAEDDHDHALGADEVAADVAHDEAGHLHDASATAAGTDTTAHDATSAHAHTTTVGSPTTTAHAHDPGTDTGHDDHAAPTVPGATEHDHTEPSVPGPTEHDHTTPTTPGTPTEPGHQHPVCTDPVTPGQAAAAADLLAASRGAMAHYEDLDVALAEGFTPITPVLNGLRHYGHPGRMSDGVYVEPSAMESLIYAFDGNGNSWLVGGMYWQDDMNVTPPSPGGCSTTWHNHTNLCIAPGKGMVGVVDRNGKCPPGSTNEVTPAMMHVWYVDLPTGPFSDLAEANRAAVLAGIVAKYG